MLFCHDRLSIMSRCDQIDRVYTFTLRRDRIHVSRQTDRRGVVSDKSLMG
jgi:hypothetical protein